MEKFLNQAGLRKTVEGIKEYIDASELDFINPIMVDNPWEILPNILNRLGYLWDATLKMNLKAGTKYAIKGSNNYPFITLSNRSYTPPLRNTMAIAELTGDLIDPELPQSPHNHHDFSGRLHNDGISAPPIKIITWGFVLWDFGEQGWGHQGTIDSQSNIILEWLLPIAWFPTGWDWDQGVAVSFALQAQGLFPIITNGRGYSISNGGASIGAPPGLGNTSDSYIIPSLQSIINATRRTNLTGIVTQTDFNLMTRPGSYSITSTSVLAHGPPQTMLGNLRRVCHVTATDGNGIIQELEIFSDAPNTPLVTWKRARRTASQDSWTPWERIYTSLI